MVPETGHHLAGDQVQQRRFSSPVSTNKAGALWTKRKVDFVEKAGPIRGMPDQTG